MRSTALFRVLFLSPIAFALLALHGACTKSISRTELEATTWDIKSSRLLSERTDALGREHPVPMPHLAVVLELPDWQALAERLKAAGTQFVMEPQVRFEGQPGEQWTMFFRDPSGNPIEIKGFRSLSTVYDA